jgi:hypothetical protein
MEIVMKTLVSLLFGIALTGSAIAKPLDAAGPLVQVPANVAQVPAADDETEQLAFFRAFKLSFDRYCWSKDKGLHGC